MEAPTTLETANQVANLSYTMFGLVSGLCVAIFAIAGLFFGHRQNSKDITDETKAREKLEEQVHDRFQEVKELNKELRTDFINTVTTLQNTMNSILSATGEIKGQMNAQNQNKRGD